MTTRRKRDELRAEATFNVDMANTMRRSKPDGIMDAVVSGGALQTDTLAELLTLLKERTRYEFHITVEINTGALLKTIDNEEDAQETILRLRTAPKVGR